MSKTQETYLKHNTLKQTQHTFPKRITCKKPNKHTKRNMDNKTMYKYAKHINRYMET